MGFLWIVTFSLCAILIGASHAPPSSGVGFTPNVVHSALEPIAVASMLLVFAFYYFRFSEWPRNTAADLQKRPPRYYTTAARYHLSAIIYGSTMTVVFLGLYLFPEAIAQLIAAFSSGLSQAQTFGQAISSGYAETAEVVGGPASIQTVSSTPAAPQVNAFFKQLGTFLEQGSKDQNWIFTVVALIIVIWPKLPFSRDDAIRNTLQRFAAIPTEARSLIRRLNWNHREFAPSPVVTYQLLGATDLLDQNDFRAFPGEGVSGSKERTDRLDQVNPHPHTTENPKRIGYQFAKLFYLTNRLLTEGTMVRPWMRDFEQQERYEEIDRETTEIAQSLRNLRTDAATLAFSKKPDEVRKRYKAESEWLRAPVQSLLDFVDEYIESDLPEMRNLQQQREEIKRRISAALQTLYFHIVTSTLAGEASQEDQRLRFKRFGFEMPRSWHPLQESNALAALISLVLLAVLVPTVAYWAISEGLSKEALAMQCGDLVLDHPADPLIWSVIAVVQNALAVIAAFVLTSVRDWRESTRGAICAAGTEELDFATFTRRVTAFLNGSSLAFAVNLLLLAVLVGPAREQGCGIGHVWTWAILPGIAGGFAALYLRISYRNRQTYQWPLWQGYVSGLAAVAVGLFVISQQSRAGATGVDLSFTPFLAAPLGIFLGLLLKARLLKPLLWKLLIVVFALALVPVGMVLLLGPGAQEGTPVSVWVSHLTDPAQLADYVPRESKVIVGTFVLALIAAVLFKLGYNLLLLATGNADDEKIKQEADCAGERSKATPGSASAPQDKKRQILRTIYWGGVAVIIGTCYGLAIHRLDAVGLGLLGAKGEFSQTQFAELSFLFYAYAAASAVGLLSGFFVLKFSESGQVCGVGLEAFMNDESLEVVLTDGDGKKGRLGVIPVSQFQAIVVSVPNSFNVEEAEVQLPNGNTKKVVFYRSTITEGTAATRNDSAAHSPGDEARQQIRMEILEA